MAGMRKQHGKARRSKVVPEALAGEKPVSQIASDTGTPGANQGLESTGAGGDGKERCGVG